MKLFTPLISVTCFIGASLTGVAQVQVPPTEVPQANLPVQSPQAEPLPVDTTTTPQAPVVETIDPGLPQSPAAPTTVMTAEELAALTSEGLEDPFQTTAAAQGARNAANAQRAANAFTIAGVIHVGGTKIAAVREVGATGRQNTGQLQYLSNTGDSALKIPNSPDLKLKVLNINASSVDLEVEGGSEVVTLR